MTFPEWNNITEMGTHAVLTAPESEALALAEVDPAGSVRHLNRSARRLLGWREGARVPNALHIALSELGQGEAGMLPTKPGGPVLLGVRMQGDAGWIVAGSRTSEGVSDEDHSTFRSLIEKMPVCATVMHEDGTVLFVNKETENLTGFSVSEMEGRPFWLDAVHPEDRWKLMSAMRQVLESGKAVDVVRFLSKQRGPRLAEMHLFATTGRQGAVIECIAIDVTEQSEVEDALFQSEALYRIFLEQSPIGMLHLDATGTVTFENHQFRQIIGEDVEDAWIGREIFEIEGLESGVRHRLRGLLERGESFRGTTVTYRRRDMPVQYLSVHGSPIHHPEGGIVGGVLMIDDRTEERRRKEELRTRDRYASAESALRKAALSDPSERTFLHEAARIIGESSEADRVYLLLNNAAGDCSSNRATWWREGSDKPQSLVFLHNEEPILRELVRERKSLHAVAHRASVKEESLLKKTGASEAIWVPFFDETRLGGFALIEREELTTDGVPAMWRDTELQLLEHLVRLFETLWSWILAGSRYRHITSTIDDCLFTFTFNEDEERRYLFATPQIERLTGYGVDEIVIQSESFVEWSDVVVHEEDRAMLDAHDDLLRRGLEGGTTYRVLHRDGSTRWLQERATPEIDSMGEIIVSGILTDVTEHKAAEAVLTKAKQEAESANRLKSAFIATMSHEIRTPMGAVNGFAELLTRELADLEEARDVDLPPQVIEFLQAIRENSEKLLTLVNDLFDLSNLEVGAVELRRTDMPLHDVVMRATSKVAVALSQKSIDLRVDLDPADPIVVGDPHRLEQVLDNLLSNAVKFTDEGSVTVRTHRSHDGRGVIEIEDTGVGIASEHLDKLFEPFVQEDSRLNRQFEGSGLGLSLVRRLLDLMNGGIEVDSIKGEGSIFRVSLPLAASDADRDPRRGRDS